MSSRGRGSWCIVALFFAAACSGGQAMPARRAVVPTEVTDAGATDAAAPETHVAIHPAADASALIAMTLAQACRLPVTVQGDAAGAKVFAQPGGLCTGAFCDVAERGPPGSDSCFVAITNLTRAERSMPGSAHAAGQSTPWDRQTPPQYFDRVDAHLHLGDAEAQLLRTNGFVVLDREGYDSYAVAFHDVFQQQLPVYVGVDAIFNAVFQASQTVLADVEKTRLGPALVRLLDRLRAALAASGYDADTTADLEIYLTVAHRLLFAEPEPPLADPSREALVTSLVESARQGTGLEEVELFGRARVVDFSQFTPRGHYAIDGGREGFEVRRGRETRTVAPREYFRAMMWLSRIELNLVSRSCRSSQPGERADPRETPREGRDALALADLVARSGALADLRAFDEVYSVFAGSREDVPLPAIAALAAKGGFGPRDPDAAAKLRAAIGEGFPRTARTHFMPAEADVLPAITTMFGPRIVPDIAPLTGLVHPAVAGRTVLGAADVAYLLGHDRAKAYLGDDLRRFPDLGLALDAGRRALAAGTRGKKDVYATWLNAALRLADPSRGTTPSFMRTSAFADQRMGSALAVYAQIRHTFVLLTGQGYDGYGCEIPDGYVEPAVAAYDALLGWIAAARRAVPTRGPYFRRVAEILETLRAIILTELSGAALSEPQRRWLGMIAEYTPADGYADSGAPPLYSGWYFELFPDRHRGAERDVALVADYFTLTNANQVRYLGIDKAALGVFVVDVSGAPRVMVGPVAKGYEVATPIGQRLDDAAALEAPGKSAPWLTSHLAKQRRAPAVAARFFNCSDGARVVVQGEGLDVSVTLLDHHGDAVGPRLSHSLCGEPGVFAFAAPRAVLDSPFGIEGIHIGVRVGPERWDFVRGPSVYHRADDVVTDRTGGRLDMAFGPLRESLISSSSSR